MNESQTLDARGLLCPMPIVRASQAIRTLDDGQILKIVATDRGAIVDVPAWASDTGNELLHSEQGSDELVFYVRKGIA